MGQGTVSVPAAHGWISSDIGDPERVDHHGAAPSGPGVLPRPASRRLHLRLLKGFPFGEGGNGQTASSLTGQTSGLPLGQLLMGLFPRDPNKERVRTRRTGYRGFLLSPRWGRGGSRNSPWTSGYRKKERGVRHAAPPEIPHNPSLEVKLQSELDFAVDV